MKTIEETRLSRLKIAIEDGHGREKRRSPEIHGNKSAGSHLSDYSARTNIWIHYWHTSLRYLHICPLSRIREHGNDHRRSDNHSPGHSIRDRKDKENKQFQLNTMQEHHEGAMTPPTKPADPSKREKRDRHPIPDKQPKK
jgi:hypothetical protein